MRMGRIGLLTGGRCCGQGKPGSLLTRRRSPSSDADPAVTVFDDLISNSTFLMSTSVVRDPAAPQVVGYFEGTNILVYIRGRADGRGKWWEAEESRPSRRT